MYIKNTIHAKTLYRKGCIHEINRIPAKYITGIKSKTILTTIFFIIFSLQSSKGPAKTALETKKSNHHNQYTQYYMEHYMNPGFQSDLPPLSPTGAAAQISKMRNHWLPFVKSPRTMRHVSDYKFILPSHSCVYY